MNVDAPSSEELSATSRATAARRSAVFVVCVLAVVFAMALQPVRSPDVWHHVGAGRFVAENGGPARTDPFSCTAGGRPWLQYEWLAQFLIYRIHRVSGTSGLILFRALGVALSALFLLLAARSRSAGRAAAAIAVVLAACAGSGRFFSRPEIFTLVLLAAWIWATERVISGKLRFALLPPLLIVFWVNLHGAWVAGIAWLGLTCAAETIPLLLRRPALSKRTVAVLCISLGAALAATLANPYGFHIWEVPFKLSASPEVRNRIAEWQRPGLDHWLDMRNIGAFVFAAAILVRPRALRLRDVFVVLFFGALSFTARRHLQLAMLATAPIFAHQLAAIGAAAPERVRRLLRHGAFRAAGAAAVCLAAAVVALGGPRFTRAGWGMDDTVYPVGAGVFLANHRIEGNLFNSYSFGNYLLYRLYPENPVFIDGRVDMYGGEIASLYERTWQAKDWRATFEGFDIQAAVIEISRRSDIPILTTLHRASDWALVYWDNLSAVYLKRSPEHAAALETTPGYRVRPDRVDYALLNSPGGLEVAEADYNRKLAEDPTAVMAHKGLAECALMRKDAEKAVAFMRRALAVQPDSADTLYNLAHTLHALKRDDEAESLFRKVIRLGEYRAESWTGLADIYADRKETAAALKCLKRAARHDPHNWRRHWNVSDFAEKAGDLTGAVRAMEEVVRLAPDNADAKARLETLRKKIEARQ